MVKQSVIVLVLGSFGLDASVVIDYISQSLDWFFVIWLKTALFCSVIRVSKISFSITGARHHTWKPEPVYRSLHRVTQHHVGLVVLQKRKFAGNVFHFFPSILFQTSRSFHGFLIGTRQRKSVNTTGENALRSAKLPRLKVICWKLTKI